MELTVQCRQTNHEGEFIHWCHDAFETVDGVVVNPGAWTHYAWSIRDALEPLTVPVVEVHLSNIDEREEWRRVSVINDVVSDTLRRARPRRLPHGPRIPQGERVNDRIARLRESLEEPLLDHEPDQRRLPRRLPQLERRAARRPGARAAVHGLPLSRGGARRRGRRGRPDEALDRRRPRRAAEGPDRLRGEGTSRTRSSRRWGAAGWSSSRARASSSGCAP